MSGNEWTHQICVPCWNEKHPERPVDPEDYEYGKPTKCCYCGKDNTSGIYYREDPKEVHDG